MEAVRQHMQGKRFQKAKGEGGGGAGVCAGGDGMWGCGWVGGGGGGGVRAGWVDRWLDRWVSDRGGVKGVKGGRLPWVDQTLSHPAALHSTPPADRFQQDKQELLEEPRLEDAMVRSRGGFSAITACLPSCGAAFHEGGCVRRD